MASTDVRNLSSPRKEQTNRSLVNVELQPWRKDGRKAIIHKSSRLWPLEALWSRVKPYKKNELLLSEICQEICEANINLPKFDWSTIEGATNQFSSSYKVAQGRFALVYKAVLPARQLVAVKRHLKYSRQFLWFKNKIFLLPNLQHRNIIKIVGYCIHRDEKLVISSHLS